MAEVIRINDDTYRIEDGSGNAAFDEFYMSAKEEGNYRDNVSDALI